MKKKILAFLIALTLSLSVAVPVFASNWVVGSDSFSIEEDDNIDQLANGLYDTYGINVLFAYSEEDESAEELATDTVDESGGESFIVYAVTATYYYMGWSADLDSYFSTDDRDEVWEAISPYESEGLYNLAAQFYSHMYATIPAKGITAGGVSTDVAEADDIAPYSLDSSNDDLPAPTAALDDAKAYAGVTNVADRAGILTDEQIKALNDKIAAAREELKLDIVIVTTNDVSQDMRMYYADDFFDYGGYGYGDDKDGVLLLVNVAPDGTYSTQNSWISTTGKGIKYFTDDDIQEVGKILTPYLLDGLYNTAFERFIELTEDEVEEYTKKDYPLIAGVAAVVGLIGAFIYTSKLKKQLITVMEAGDADEYIVPGSLNVSQAYDNFLYSSVSRVEKESKSSGGSSTHSGSSGTSHGGGGF